MGQTRGGQALTVAAGNDVIQYAVGSFEINPATAGDNNFVVRADFFNNAGNAAIVDGSRLSDGDIITPLGSSIVFHTATGLTPGPSGNKSYSGEIITIGEGLGLVIQRGTGAIQITEMVDDEIVYQKNVNLRNNGHTIQVNQAADAGGVAVTTIKVLGGVLFHGEVA